MANSKAVRSIIVDIGHEDGMMIAGCLKFSRMSKVIFPVCRSILSSILGTTVEAAAYVFAQRYSCNEYEYYKKLLKLAS